MALKISGFTYVRNGLNYGYPFVQSIQSLLPLVDELIVVVGDSVDGTREAVEHIQDSKIKILDSIWDDKLREGGKVFAQQSNLGLDQITGDWGFHIQVDEVLHERDYPLIRAAIEKASQDDSIDGILFPFLHFWGDYQHIRNTRNTHSHEIRLFKNRGVVRSYKDSQGFRKYESLQAYEAGAQGEKLKVSRVLAPVFHYSYTRNPKLMKQKATYFHKFWHNDDWMARHREELLFDFNDVDRLEPYKDSHPAVMASVISSKDWDFTYNVAKSNMSFKEKVLYRIEKLWGIRLFENKNYILIK